VVVEQLPGGSRRRLATIQPGVGRRPVDVVFDDGSNDLSTTGISIPLRNGSQLTIYPRMVETEEAMKLTDEIMSRHHLFRQYRVQGFNNERRLQAQFHHKATDDFHSPQPGYRYNNQTTLKGRPLSTIPSLERLADRLKKLCKVPVWSIGATIVVYRNGRDKMGQHRGKYRFHDH
jgi:2OG-Fe(II) oxygenase superfamily